MRALSYYREVIWAAQEGWIDSLAMSRVDICITKVSEFSNIAVLANFFWLMSSTWLVVNKTSIVMYNLQVSFLAPNWKSVLLKIKKDIFKITSILMSASQKVPTKNQTLLRLSWSKNLVKVISWVFRSKLSFFSALILIFEVMRLSFTI